MDPQSTYSECQDVDKCAVTDPSTIEFTFVEQKQAVKPQRISVHIPDEIRRRSAVQTSTTVACNSKLVNRYPIRRKRRNSWPPFAIQRVTIDDFLTMPVTAASPDILKTVTPTSPNERGTLPAPIVTPERPSFSRSKTQPTLSILKEPRTPKSNSSRTVVFDDARTEKVELLTWYHIDSPRKSTYPNLPTGSSHTIMNTEFTTDLDDPNDFGPCHDPNPTYLGDLDYQHKDESESLCDYLCCTVM